MAAPARAWNLKMPFRTRVSVSLPPASFVISCQTPQDLCLPCLAAAEDNVFPGFLVSHQPLLHVSQMLCLSLFLPVYNSGKRPSGTEMHTQGGYTCEKLFFAKLSTYRDVYGDVAPRPPTNSSLWR